nr:Ig-like domain-containing protein [Lactobacillus colini]
MQKNEIVKPENAGFLYGDYSFSLPSEVKSGDRFKISWGDTLTPNGVRDSKALGAPNVTTKDGKNIVATGKFDDDYKGIEFTLTPYVDGKQEINASISFPLYINPEVVKNSSYQDITTTVGNQSATQTIYVDYLPLTGTTERTEYLANGEAFYKYLNPKTGTFTGMVYVNPKNRQIYDESVNIRNLTASEISSRTRDTNAVDSEISFNNSDTQVKVYQLNNGAQLNQSFALNSDDLTDVTDQAGISYDNNELNVTMPSDSDYSPNANTYVIVFNTKFNPDARMAFNSNISGKTSNGLPTYWNFAIVDSDPAAYKLDADGSGIKNGQFIVRYVDIQDEKNPKKIFEDVISGNYNASISYTTQSSIEELQKKGYIFVSDGYTGKAGSVIGDNNNGKTYLVEFKHATVTITPDKPGNPGQPINPNDPDGNGPKWSEDTGKDSLQRTGTQTIHYQGAGDKTPKDNVQTTTFNHTLVIDKVTGKVIEDKGWSPENHTFNEVTTPNIAGYHADQKSAGGAKVTPDDLTKSFTVTYTKNGKIVPVDPNDNPIPGADTPTYETDPNDPTKVVPNEPVPTVPGYTPSVETVTPNDPGKDTPVVYTKNETPATPMKLTVKYIDLDNNNSEIVPDKVVSGNEGSKIDYKTTDTIADLENKGYVLQEDGFTGKSGSTFSSSNNGHTYEVTFHHAKVTITPDEPGNPGQPINPNDPDGNGPKWGEDTGKDSLQRTGTQTIHYQGAGDKTPKDNVQTTTFNHTLVIDKVTGKVIEDKGWSPENHTFNEVTTPNIAGYHADKKVAGNKTVTPENPTTEETVTYTENGKIVPVDPNGKQIPGADTPIYETDPHDPTKVVPNEPVPTVPGYTPSVETVTPNDPGKDTPVVYTKNETPATPMKLTVKYIDLDNNNSEIIPDKVVSGNEGSKIDYKTTDTITALKNKGYVLEEDGYTNKVGNDLNVDNNGKIYLVTFHHGSATSTPQDPSDPGTPINKEDPNGPKWPAGSNEVTKNASQTIRYNGAGEHTPDKHVTTQDGAFTRTITVDKVTGKTTKTENWNPQTHSFNDVNTPVIDGYHADKNIATTVPATPDKPDVATDITYYKNGKIIPVDPNGNPIPGAETPTYETDPHDPTKVVPNEPVPTVPGYTPSVKTVTPNDPGKDTPVVYTRVTPPTTDGKVTRHITYTGIDDKDSKTPTPVDQEVTTHTTSGKTTADGNYPKVDNPVVPGYHTEKPDVPEDAPHTDGTDTNVEVPYKKNGKIVPVDPEGNPIPNAPTPTYETDPHDPTKVVPNEPVPTVPGYTSSVKTVTPNDPGKDTPVVYTKVVTPTNPTPQNQINISVVYVTKDNDGKENVLKTDILTGNEGDWINYSTDSIIKSFEKQGYKLVSDGFTNQAGSSFTNANNGKTYTVVLEAVAIPVTPDQTPSTPDNDTPSTSTNSEVPVANTGKSTARVVSTSTKLVNKSNVRTSKPAAPSVAKGVNRDKLPQTGSQDSDTLAKVGAGLLLAAGLVGLVGYRKRRN